MLSRTRLVQKLLKTHGVNPNAVNDSRTTPLHLAAIRATDEVIALLLAAGARPNAQYAPLPPPPLFS